MCVIGAKIKSYATEESQRTWNAQIMLIKKVSPALDLLLRELTVSLDDKFGDLAKSA